ncbi:MAG: CoA transferase [Alphaproteobacteria bacterium]|nr:CoA transferase [Alphaproteobacteria bacterium]MBU1515230.1 CoA transferase [Alphaproteobacteria bacterium]MBU2092360.1 CoA transferase [Alphaproteobacteria bacterium]MBU2152954.1 CoA transferase [Alphaproteobacteria bacterium]MBU2305785.1 CoA transferase [Alphaproteobacteria bacterium]
MLEGLKVVEMATWVAGPSAAAVLADWGAEVVKVEGPIGDATRVFQPDTAESPGNPIFTNENRGKKGVMLDLARPEGRRALKVLLSTADIFVTNVRPGSLKRMGFDYDSLKAEFPTLIYAAVTGYGLVGPEADVPAFDITAFWTRSGVARAMIPPDQEPFPSRPGFGDHVTALATVSAILAAVHERHSTGKGRLVETSLIRAGAYAVSWDLAMQLRYGEVLTTQARDDRPVGISGFFRTGDDRYFCIVPRTVDCFTNMMIAIDRPEVLAEPRFEAPIVDMETTREVRAMCDEAFGKMTLAEAGERLTAGDIAWAPMGTLEELASADYAETAGCFITVEDGWGGSFRGVASPARFPEGAPPVGRAAPKLGEHTREVLEAAGLTAEEIAAVL